MTHRTLLPALVARLPRLIAAASLPIGLAAVPALAGCGSPASSNDATDPQGTSDDALQTSAPLAWAAPVGSTPIRIDEPVELSVHANHPEARAVRFAVDGKAIATCDPTADAEEDCRRGDFFRWTTTFATPGTHHLVATFATAEGEVRASKTIQVLPAGVDPDVAPETGAPENAEEQSMMAAAAAEEQADGVIALAASAGVRDPNRALHNVFGGVRWSVSSDKVIVTKPPAGSVSLVTTCMKRYGASIQKWADHFKLSRASVVATAIAESSCTDPRGSSDGLSSGPMQVTASTCASIMGISSATCRARMFSSPDFSFEVGAKYMASAFQVRQHQHDPPKIGAAYNAGSIRSSTANRWHMLVTGNHIERWVGGYNAYRAWETANHVAAVQADAAEVDSVFDGQSVATKAALPANAREGQVIFVGNFAERDGDFAEFRGGRWTLNSERE